MVVRVRTDNSYSFNDTDTGSIQQNRQPLDIPSAELAVYGALREEIVSGLQPGTQLKLGPLAARFNVSTMPVRAALTRLEAEGLAMQRPRRGAVVAELTVRDFMDNYAVRVALEGVAARIGAPVLRDAVVQRMYEVLDTKMEIPGAGDQVDEYLRRDWELHDLCYNACGRPGLLNLIEIHRRQGERYFRHYLGHTLDLAGDCAEQRKFVDACAARDPDAAERAVRSLFHLTTEQVLQGFPSDDAKQIPRIQL